MYKRQAHDVRTPLTLIKAPLEEVVEKDMVKAEGMDNVRMALKSVDTNKEISVKSRFNSHFCCIFFLFVDPGSSDSHRILIFIQYSSARR